ncbi:hypothetical protein OAK45_03470 [Verrucomicrobia bacterium]|nr:hypothetical protein [Verrucomicrobiota bacterium]
MKQFHREQGIFFPVFVGFGAMRENKCRRFRLADTTKCGSFPPGHNILWRLIYRQKRGKRAPETGGV